MVRLGPRLSKLSLRTLLLVAADTLLSDWIGLGAFWIASCACNAASLKRANATGSGNSHLLSRLRARVSGGDREALSSTDW
jgi:hypothetical protein